ncbi:hypothetical protein L5515_018648 [Caenorhabditis briggsae]|uniref:Uncharacterized protein n=1 Tax=Caenorhabditis briggsae TaxID=6238 RepID=A0AAE9FJV8_CAEBR|nr:hypothetical protein L5515_018648 [Caenorhabditis briggsae]
MVLTIDMSLFLCSVLMIRSTKDFFIGFVSVSRFAAINSGMCRLYNKNHWTSSVNNASKEYIVCPPGAHLVSET